MSNGSDPPIVINGGASISIDFPDNVFPPEAGKKGKFKNANKKIKSVTITGTGIPNYNESAKGKDVVITVYYED